MKLSYKIIIGIAIGIIAIFAIMIAVVLVVSVNTMSQFEDEFVERAIEIRELNDAQIIENVNLDEEQVQERMVQPTTILPSTPDCDKSYPDFCIVPYPPDLDCEEIPASNFRVMGDDPHGLGADYDGIGCEVGSPSSPVPTASSDPVPAAQKIIVIHHTLMSA